MSWDEMGSSPVMSGRNVGFVNKWPESRQVEEEWILTNDFAGTGNQVSTVHRVSGGAALPKKSGFRGTF